MRPIHRLLAIVPLAAAVGVGAAGASAEPFRDGATGLAVAPPPGYAARSLPPNPGQAARVEVKTPADTDTGCSVAFAEVAQNHGVSQPELDAAMRDRAWQDKARAAVSAIYDVAEAQVLELGGGRLGFALVGDFKPRPALPPRSQEVRSLLVLQETPRGRTTTACVADKAEFEARRAGFVAVASGAAPP